MRSAPTWRLTCGLNSLPVSYYPAAVPPTPITPCHPLEHLCYYITMKINNNQEPKRKRGAQPGNQNARTHGRYSLIISPRALEVLKAVGGLDVHSRLVIYKWLMDDLLELERKGLLESHSFQPVPEKAEPIPLTADFDREFAAWAKELNIDPEEFMREARKTNQG